ncbi:MAG: deoxyribose-phosphate aldolase [Anaerolineaceae bacterium]|nr:deoxyribose-phosphate aldolase [Anaerolineaceae bacterium]
MTNTIASIVQLADQYEQELPAFPQHIQPADLEVARYIDHSILKPDTTPAMIEKACREAREEHFAAVSINPVYLPMIVRLLKGSDVKAGTVVSFPLGAGLSKIKAHETRVYIEDGAEELDTMIQVGLLKAGEYQAVIDDVAAVAEAAHPSGVIVKVIFENCLLTRREKILACLLCQAAGADFVKTSSGFSSGGATLEDVDLMRRVVGPVSKMGVKAATGVKTLEIAQSLLRGGANRLGTSSGVRIMDEARSKQAVG